MGKNSTLKDVYKNVSGQARKKKSQPTVAPPRERDAP